jgi:hypothetical protein
MDTKLPDFSAMVDTEIARVQGLKRSPESEGFQKACLSNSDFLKGLTATMSVSSEKFAAVIQGGFPDEQSLLDTMKSRGVSGPIMDLVLFGYFIGKKVGENTGFEQMFQSSFAESKEGERDLSDRNGE